MLAAGIEPVKPEQAEKGADCTPLIKLLIVKFIKQTTFIITGCKPFQAMKNIIVTIKNSLRTCVYNYASPIIPKRKICYFSSSKILAAFPPQIDINFPKFPRISPAVKAFSFSHIVIVLTPPYSNFSSFPAKASRGIEPRKRQPC